MKKLIPFLFLLACDNNVSKFTFNAVYGPNHYIYTRCQTKDNKEVRGMCELPYRQLSPLTYHCSLNGKVEIGINFCTLDRNIEEEFIGAEFYLGKKLTIQSSIVGKEHFNGREQNIYNVRLISTN